MRPSPFAVALVWIAIVLPAAVDAQTPTRMAGTALGQRAEIEVRDLTPDAAHDAIRAAFAELESAGATLRALEESAAAAGGSKPVTVDATTGELVRRAEAFCIWSEGAVSPLGGEIYRLFGLRSPAAALPAPDELQQAIASGRCDRLSWFEERRELTVAAGSRLDFYPFVTGWAVDRAAARLRGAGARNFWIGVGPMMLGAGAGPGGLGWEVVPPPFPGLVEPLPSFYLRDRAAALLTSEDRPLRIAGDRFSSYIDLRRGRPGGAGLLAVFVVAELAVDAQGVGYAMFALGPRDGTMLFGTLTPRPSARWILGTGAGPPVLTDVNWSIVPRN